MPVLTENSAGVLQPASTPLSFLKRNTLPVAAYLRTPTITPGLNLSRPILLFSCYTSKKVRASSLKLQRDGTFARTGPPLVIPDTYSGWFSLITADGHTATCHSTIEEIVAAKIPFFLTRTDITAYIINDEADPRGAYKKTVVHGGNVLKLLGIFEDFNRRTLLNRRNSAENVPKIAKYAQCLNFQNEIIYIPLATNGKFYATAQKSTKSHTKIYLMNQLVKNFKFPISVKLVCGYMPKTPCSFTGIIALEKSYQEDVILACTMTSKATATFFEMEVESNFLLAHVTDAMFQKSPIYLKTLSYCQDEAETWQKQMKITHSVSEKRTRSLTRSLSDKFSDPLSSIRNSSLSIDQDEGRSRGRFGLAKAWESFIEKDPKKKTDKKHRRLCKQNTYVFDLVKRHRISRKNDTYSRLGTRRSHSFDNLEYCQVRDKLGNHNYSEESIYAEIGEPSSKESTIPSDDSSGKQSDASDDDTYKNSKAYTESETLMLPKLRMENSADSCEKGKEVSVVSVEPPETFSKSHVEECDNDSKENKSRIVMRGNTVVIRVKDACDARPTLTEQTVNSIFNIPKTCSTKNVIFTSTDQDLHKIKIMTNDSCAKSDFSAQPSLVEA